MDIPFLTNAHIRDVIKPRQPESHKGTFGHAFLIAGDTGKMGAAVMSATACLRSGVGLLTVNIPKKERLILQTSIPEAMLIFRNENPDYDRFSAAGIGPAIGLHSGAKEILSDLLDHFKKNIVIDADALTILSAEKKLLDNIGRNVVLTPHPEEFDRMFGEHKNTEARIETAINFSKAKKCTIVLKGHHTLITSNGHSFLNNTGNAGLAKGGSGDVLTGMITALLAQGYDPFSAAKAGVWLHGTAADIVINERMQSMESMLASDVVLAIGKAFLLLEVAALRPQ